MLRLIFASAILITVVGHTGTAVAAQTSVTEATVEKACGDQIEGGCIKKLCATGCRKKVNGKTYDYGCTFSSKPGKTKATCTKTLIGN
jgi:hypothetical protein